MQALFFTDIIMNCANIHTLQNITTFLVDAN